MSTNALDARATSIPDFYSSLEYLVAPLPVRLNAEQADEQRSPGEPMSSPGNEVNNSLQKLTNLVYLLAERCSSDDQSRTAITLMQAEIAHLAVLFRKQAVAAAPERAQEKRLA